jgi:hypothetical protein
MLEPPPLQPLQTDQHETDINDLVIGNFGSDTVPQYEGKYDFSTF